MNCSQLDPVENVAKIVKEQLVEVLDLFGCITNAEAERLNPKVESIQKLAAPFRNEGHLLIAVMFKCRGISRYPTSPRSAGYIGKCWDFAIRKACLARRVSQKWKGHFNVVLLLQ